MTKLSTRGYINCISFLFVQLNKRATDQLCVYVRLEEGGGGGIKQKNKGTYNNIPNAVVVVVVYAKVVFKS